MLLPRTFSLLCTNTLIAGCRHSFQIKAVKCKRNGNILFGYTFLCLVGRERLIYSQVMLQLVRCNSKKWHNDMIATQRLYCAIPGNTAHNTIWSFQRDFAKFYSAHRRPLIVVESTFNKDLGPSTGTVKLREVPL